ncbi:MAG: zinc-ribbon domain-containing protein [Ruminococcaceae bacterium]|nr:zinc-ribbon domain-containing protein [Oscillospiraceae bacterium]
MALCKKCGTKMDGGVKFCPGCGAPVEAPAQQAPPASGQNDFSAKFANLNNTADTTAQFDQNDINNNKAMGILAYLGPLCFIPMFAAKESKFARFHANQGLLLFIAGVAWSIVYSIFSWIILAISWRLYFVSSIVGLCSLVFLVLCIIGIINAANGKAKELPVIGRFKILK